MLARVYRATVAEKSKECRIEKLTCEDVSGTGSHTRSVLQAWLDCRVTGESVTAF